MTPILEISTSLTGFGFFLTLLYSTLLIYLTVYRIRKISAAYKAMIVSFAVLGIVFATWEQVARPCIHNFNASFIYFSYNVSANLSTGFLEFALAAYGFLFSALYSFIAVQFVYRLMCLEGSHVLNKFGRALIVLAVCHVTLFGAMFGLFFYALAKPDEFSDGYMRKEVERVYNMRIESLPRFIVIPYGANGELRASNVIALAGTVLIITFQYLIIIYCGLRMRAHIQHKLSTCSFYSRHLEHQFFRALVVQIVSPTVLLTIPSFFVLICPFFDLKISVQSGVIYTLFSFYAPVESMSFMWIVSEYRCRIREVVTSLGKTLQHDIEMEAVPKNLADVIL